MLSYKQVKEGYTMKPTFLGHKRPLLCDMIIVETPTECVIHTRNAIYDGAEAFGIQMERLRPEFRTEDMLTKMFAHMEDKPIYITSYRKDSNEGKSDVFSNISSAFDGLKL